MAMDDVDRKLIISTFGETKPQPFICPDRPDPSLGPASQAQEREDQFDFYDYGQDQEGWTGDDHYFYYGANTAESCLTYFFPFYNTDWHASSMSRVNTITLGDAGDIFSEPM
ncbi:MAG: hypothetical protein Ct9H300mP9_7040 [Candidatus Neomarinimicrobiota bacterium]|nr:MAG: hypothetical protein Ct9H300mP9_7040 [Candidatus Neomarinimicrobiota bacterium]